MPAPAGPRRARYSASSTTASAGSRPVAAPPARWRRRGSNVGTRRVDDAAIPTGPGRTPTPARNGRPIQSRTSWLLLGSCLLDDAGDAIELRLAEPRAIGTQQRRHHLLHRAVEEGVDDVLERRLADNPARHHGQVDVAQPVGLVADVALGFEHAQLRAHGRIARLARQGLDEIGGRRAAELVEDVHDLLLAARQLGVEGLAHRYFPNGDVIKITPRC